MLDFLIACAQFVCFLGLIYGVILTFHAWRESGQFWGDVDPILADERVAMTERLATVDPVLELTIEPIEAKPQATSISRPHVVS